MTLTARGGGACTRPAPFPKFRHLLHGLRERNSSVMNTAPIVFNFYTPSITMQSRLILSIAALLASAVPSPAQQAPAPAATAAEKAPDSFTVGALTFKRPSDWTWVPVVSPMRKAQLSVSGPEAGKNADITFFHFGPSGGGDLDSNVQRWLRQFQSAPNSEKVEAKTIGGRKTTLVSTVGTFSSGMPGQPAAALENYALMGAIVEDADGNVFVKMTGPKTTVQAAGPKFLEFLEGAKR